MEQARVENIFRDERLSVHRLLPIFILSLAWMPAQAKTSVVEYFQVEIQQFDVDLMSDLSDQRHLMELGSAFAIGLAILADLHGRKTALFIALFLALIGMGLTLVAPVYILVCVGLFLKGLSLKSSKIIALIIAFESSPARFRGIIVACFSTSLIIGHRLVAQLSGVNWIITSTIVLALSAAIVFGIYKYSLESLQYLIMAGPANAVKEWMERRKIVQSSNDVTQLNENVECESIEIEDEATVEATNEIVPPTARLLFSSIDRRTVAVIIICTGIWFVTEILEDEETNHLFEHHEIIEDLPNHLLLELISVGATAISVHFVGCTNSAMASFASIAFSFLVFGIRPNTPVAALLSISTFNVTAVLPLFFVTLTHVRTRVTSIYSIVVLTGVTRYLRRKVPSLAFLQSPFSVASVALFALLLVFLVNKLKH